VSFAKIYISANGHKVHKIAATDQSSGLRAYYFLLVSSKQKEASLKEALESNQVFDLEEHGEIIASCTGDEPNDELKKYLKNEYGFNV
jgi:hypothetical protein